MPVTINHYTRKILESGELRKRLTANLIEVLNHVAEHIAESCDVGTKVTVDGKTYEVAGIRTHRGIQHVLATEEGNVFYGNAPSETVYIDNCFSAQRVTASKDDYLHFAKNFVPIIQAFEVKQKEALNELQKAFDYLKYTASQAESQA